LVQGALFQRVKEEVHKEFRWGNLKERDHMEDSGVDGRIIFRCIFGKKNRGWTGLIWLMIGTGVGH
jgi:hypothetical protein